MRWNYLCTCNNRCLFFRRLKINHESHEFILESGTVANSKYERSISRKENDRKEVLYMKGVLVERETFAGSCEHGDTGNNTLGKKKGQSSSYIVSESS